MSCGSISRSSFLFEHDLFGKPDTTFPDHALSKTFRERILAQRTSARDVAEKEKPQARLEGA
jgi:hypothetical protein